MAGISDADQGGLSVPRFDPCRADRAGLVPVPRSGEEDAFAAQYRHPGMAELLSEVAADRSGIVPGARSVHSVDEAEEHAAAYHGREPDHAPGAGVLRLRVFSLVVIDIARAPEPPGLKERSGAPD